MASVRAAHRRDRPLFAHRWRSYLEEVWQAGGDIRPTDRSLGAYLGLFDAYLSGELFGVVTLAGEGEAVLLCGEGWGTPPLDSRYDRIITITGVYVIPAARGQGWGKALIWDAGARVRRMGFDAMVYSQNPLNDAASGILPMAKTVGLVKAVDLRTS
jgi:ribosomal protein S18 acetylase RimI-like enzyme